MDQFEPCCYWNLNCGGHCPGCLFWISEPDEEEDTDE